MMRATPKQFALLALVFALSVALVAPALAQAACAPLQFEASKRQIEMGMGYSGETVAVSGLAPEGSQVAVLAISEHNPPLKLSRKGKVVLFWMTVKKLEAQNMPYLYKLYTSAPLSETASAEAARQLGLGYNNLQDRLQIECLAGEPTPDDHQVVFDGFIKLKERDGLYGVAEGAVKASPDGRFEQTLTFPDKSPEGKYFIHVYAFKDGKLVAAGQTEVGATKVGLGRWLTTTARENGLGYGIMAVLVALGAGLGVGMIFKKGGAH